MPPPLVAAAAHRLTLRPERDEDRAFLDALYASTREQELAVTGWPEAMRRAFTDQQHRAQRHHYRACYAGAEWLIVERDGAPVGRLYLHESAGEIRLVDVALMPDARGHGIGEALMRDLLADAAAKAKPVVLHVEPGNPAARLYARLGFVKVPADGHYLRMEKRP